MATPSWTTTIYDSSLTADAPHFAPPATPSRSPYKETLHRRSPTKQFRPSKAALDYDEFHKLVNSETSTAAEKELASRVVRAAERLKEWCTEIEQWGWEGSFDKGHGRLGDDPFTEVELCASLPMCDVEEYDTRLDEIDAELRRLEVDELKEQILGIHLGRSRPSSSYSTASLANLVLYDDFQLFVTETLMYTLPYHAKLKHYLRAWYIRLAVFTETPVYLKGLQFLQEILREAWQGLQNASTTDADVAEISALEEHLEMAQDALKGKVSELGSQLDKMLDMLEGEDDRLPDAWIDKYEENEKSYTDWSYEADRKLFQLRMLEHDLERRKQVAAEQLKVKEEAPISRPPVQKSSNPETTEPILDHSQIWQEEPATAGANRTTVPADVAREEEGQAHESLAPPTSKTEPEIPTLMDLIVPAKVSHEIEQSHNAIRSRTLAEVPTTVGAIESPLPSSEPSIKKDESYHAASNNSLETTAISAGAAAAVVSLGVLSTGSKKDRDHAPSRSYEDAPATAGASRDDVPTPAPTPQEEAYHAIAPTQGSEEETSAAGPVEATSSAKASLVKDQTSITSGANLKDVDTTDLALTRGSEKETSASVPVDTTSPTKTFLIKDEAPITSGADTEKFDTADLNIPNVPALNRETIDSAPDEDEGPLELHEGETQDYTDSSMDEEPVIAEVVHRPVEAILRRASVASVESFTRDQIKSVDVPSRRNSGASFASASQRNSRSFDSNLSSSPLDASIRKSSKPMSPLSIEPTIEFPILEPGRVLPRPQTPSRDIPQISRSRATSIASNSSYMSDHHDNGEESPSMRASKTRTAQLSKPPLNFAMKKRRSKTSVDDSRAPSNPFSDNEGLAVDTSLPTIPSSPSKMKSPLSPSVPLEEQISSILDSIPAHIRFKSGPSPSAADIKPKHKRRTSTSSVTSESAKPGAIRSRAPTPSLSTRPTITLAPADDLPRRMGAHDPEIKIYHLTSGNDKPLKLFVRRVGENGERVMVRVGGGWADLADYLKNYAEHHGHRAVSEGRVEVLGLGNDRALTPTPGSGGRDSRVGFRSDSRQEMRSESRLGNRVDSRQGMRTDSRRSSLISSIGYPSLIAPTNITSSPALPVTSPDTPVEGADDATPTTAGSQRKTSTFWDEGGLMGPAALANKKGVEMSDEKKEWVDSVVAQAKNVGRTTKQVEFGDLGKKGGTRRVFVKGGRLGGVE